MLELILIISWMSIVTVGMLTVSFLIESYRFNKFTTKVRKDYK